MTSRTKLGWQVLALSGLILSLPGAFTLALAQASEVVTPHDVPATMDESELRDLTQMAADDGVTVADEIARYGWQVDFGDALGRLQQQYPGAFASASINEAGPIGAVVTFVGSVPADAAEFFRGLEAPVDLQSNGLYSERALRQAVSIAHAAGWAAAADHSVSTEYNEASRAITLSVGSPGGSDSLGSDEVSEPVSAAEVRAVETAAETAVDDLHGSVSQIPVAVEVVDDVSGEDTIRGGAILNFPGTSDLACTSGWPVAGTGGVTEGLITAEHCPNDMTYTGRYVLDYSRRLPYTRGDVQYMSSTEDVGTGFYYAVGEYKGSTGFSTPYANQYLCKFGRTSGNTCDHVRDTFTCRDEYCNLVDMDNREAASGDSGGPWYYGTTAYGVHSGYHWASFGRHDQFTPLYNTLGDLSVRLKHN